jgi:hypothetical protein
MQRDGRCNGRLATPFGYTVACGRAVQAGMRQSIPSTSIESCAAVSETTPACVCGQTNLPFSSLLATKIAGVSMLRSISSKVLAENSPLVLEATSRR